MCICWCVTHYRLQGATVDWSSILTQKKNSRELIDSSWNVMAHGDARERKWRGSWRMGWVASNLHTNSEHDVSSITTVDAQNSVAGSRLNWRPRQFKWIRPFRRKTKSGFYACVPSHFNWPVPVKLGDQDKCLNRSIQLSYSCVFW